jgi:hypothetical protein
VGEWLRVLFSRQRRRVLRDGRGASGGWGIYSEVGALSGLSGLTGRAAFIESKHRLRDGMDFAEIRRLTITALFADDKLVDELVLKGGNALNIVYELTTRTSLDLDFSMEKDFEDLKDIEARISRALSDRFDSAGYVVFDLTLLPKPQVEGFDERPWWGGYELNFKFIEKEKHLAFRDDLERLRRSAAVLGPRQRRTFRVDMSKHEFIQGKVSKELDHYTIYVYPPAMLAIEKLRAICQQMPEYGMRGHRTARARDFYDIHQILTKTGIDLMSADNFK